MFERAEQWSQDLEDNYEQLDKWKREGDYLLYSMLPKSVADQLQNGQTTMNTCKASVRIKIITSVSRSWPGRDYSPGPLGWVLVKSTARSSRCRYQFRSAGRPEHFTRSPDSRRQDTEVRVPAVDYNRKFNCSPSSPVFALFRPFRFTVRRPQLFRVKIQ